MLFDMTWNPTTDKTLPNGATILMSSRKPNGSWVWLAYMGKGNVSPYVTWLSGKQAPGHTFWGHYFTTYEKARTDFWTRTR